MELANVKLISMCTGTTIGWDEDIWIPKRDDNSAPKNNQELIDKSMILVNHGPNYVGERKIFTIEIGDLNLNEIKDKLKRLINE